jgi:Mrp family chromosome partitioning ATPase
LGGPDRPRTLLLTSAETGEGKTFLTLAMAQFGAATGQRILAVEADLRQPDFRAALGLADGPGLADLLRGEIGHAAVVRPSGFGFDVLPAGAATIASTELLSNGRIAALLDWARDKYDLVLIDSPPAQVLMDAHVLASRVDGVLYCARWGHSSVETVADSVRSLRLTGARIVGLALGMVDPREYALYAPSKLPRGPYLMAPS